MKEGHASKGRRRRGLGRLFPAGQPCGGAYRSLHIVTPDPRRGKGPTIYWPGETLPWVAWARDPAKPLPLERGKDAPPLSIRFWQAFAPPGEPSADSAGRDAAGPWAQPVGGTRVAGHVAIPIPGRDFLKREPGRKASVPAWLAAFTCGLVGANKSRFSGISQTRNTTRRMFIAV